MAGGAVDLEAGCQKRRNKPIRIPRPSRRARFALERFYTRPGVDPMSEVEWDLRSAVITGEDGRVVFEQQRRRGAARMVADRDQRGGLEVLPRPARKTPRRDAQARDLGAPAHRCASSIPSPDGARNRRYFADAADARDTFQRRADRICWSTQKASFNSPVYFNVGIEPKPQCSACFILKVDDNMESILGWYRNEGMIFKGGSGSGVNLSALRSCKREAFRRAAPPRDRSPS